MNRLINTYGIFTNASGKENILKYHHHQTLIKIDFDGDQIAVTNQNEMQYIAMRPICDALDLDWEGQYQLIKRDPVLDATVCIIQIVASDNKVRDMLCLPLQYLNGWLFKINASRYEGERREKIIRYQKECYQVLFDHFFGKRAKSFSSDFQSLDRYRQAMKKERLFIREQRNFEELAASEAKRIATGKGSIDDLDQVPGLQKAVMEIIENNPQYMQGDEFLYLLDCLLEEYKASPIRPEGLNHIKMLSIPNERTVVASSRGLCNAFDWLARHKNVDNPFHSPRVISRHIAELIKKGDRSNWRIILKERILKGYAMHTFNKISGYPMHVS